MEIWKAIPEYEQIYEVSSFGKVRRIAGYGCKKTRKLKQFSSGDGYLSVSLYKKGKRKSCKVHGLVMLAFYGPTPKGCHIDHANNNELDNRLINLRFATFSQNKGNARKQHGEYSSKFKGVSSDRNNKWRARITHNSKLIYLGSFEDEFDAARAYDSAAKKIYGQFARLNFHGEKQRC